MERREQAKAIKKFWSFTTGSLREAWRRQLRGRLQIGNGLRAS